MSSKAKLNFGVDVTIAAAFALSALSGIVLLLVPGGYQGGRNALYGTQVLLSHSAWSALHTWASLVMIAGVLLHVALHWNWIVCMVKRSVNNADRRPASSPACAVALDETTA